MAITEAQRANRYKHLGSSDLPAIMGFSRFQSPYDVWLLKTQRVKPVERTEHYIEAGNRFERSVLEWFNEYIDEPLRVPNQLDGMERTVDGTPIVVHLDAAVEKTGDPVEAKTTGLFGPIQTPWGESGTDEVPEYECIQAHCHLMATDRELCHVPAFLGGRGFQYFFVKRDNALVDLIREQAVTFWHENVLKDIPPAECAPSLAMAKRIRHIEGDPVALDPELIDFWLDAKENAKKYTKLVEFHQAEILAALDGAELGFCGGTEITNFSQNRKGYTVEPTSFRVLRLKKTKK